MRFIHNLAMAAGVFCAPTLAAAQYYSYGAPATLPAPASQVRPMSYTGGNYPMVSTAQETVQTPTAVPVQEGYAPSVNPYDNALSHEGGCSTCNGGSGACDEGVDYGFGGYGCGPSWFAGVAGLYMERNRPNPFQVSFDTTNPVGELILNIDTVGDWEGGFEVRVGKYFGCSSAVEAVYWTLDNFEGEVYAYNPVGIGSLNTPFDFRSLNFNGVPVNDVFNDAEVQRLRRRDEFHNAEINFLQFPMSCNPCSRMQGSLLAGFRYINFRESWEFSSSFGSPTFGVDPANEGHYSIDVENNLFGFQLGGRGSFALTQQLSVYAAPRAGVFWNNINHHSVIADGNGVDALDIRSDRDVFSMLGQLDVGLNYQFTPCVGVWGGYRVLAISGIALSDEQIPFLADDAFGISDIDHNSNLVLHGFMGGVTVTF